MPDFDDEDEDELWGSPRKEQPVPTVEKKMSFDDLLVLASPSPGKDKQAEAAATSSGARSWHHVEPRGRRLVRILRRG